MLADIFDASGDGNGLPTHLSFEDTRRFRLLKRLAEDEAGGLRAGLVVSAEQIAAIRQLREEAPHFDTILKIVLAAATLSHHLKRPLSVPPILLLGEPGLGKTWIAKRLAEVLGQSFHLFAMNAAPSMFTLAGLTTAWRGAGPGRISTALVDGPTASPVCVFDEIDKAISLISDRSTLRFTPLDLRKGKQHALHRRFL